MESTNTHHSELDIKPVMPAKSEFGPTTSYDLSKTFLSHIAMPFHIFALVANGSNEDNRILTIL